MSTGSLALRRAHFTRIGVLAAAAGLVLSLAPPAHASTDTDGDGTPDTSDCQWLDPAVAPGKPDKPDLAFEDTNCDGIDGDMARAVFVSVTGASGGIGTMSIPYNSIQAGINAAAAATPIKDVYVTGGTFSGALNAADGVGIFGGYAPGTWTRASANVTTIVGAPQAVLADADEGVVLQLLSLEGSPDSSGSAYGLRAINGSTMLTDRVSSRAGDAADGRSGASSPALSKLTGSDGGPGGAGICGGANETPPAGAGGARPLSAGWEWGGRGGDGGRGLTLLPGPFEPGGGNTSEQAGANGQSGANGAAGSNAAFTFQSADIWRPLFGGTGGQGGGGDGGNGGAGGRGSSTDVFFVTYRASGGGGGGGGSGGQGGLGGGGGASGGGSFGAFLYGSRVVAVDSTFAAGDGGSGGNGGAGGRGGPGGSGGIGGAGVTCGSITSAAGDRGGNGGNGGNGGPGGAGAGGPSAGVYRSGTGSAYVSRSSTEQADTAGAGGWSPGGGQAASGQTGAVLTPPGTANTVGDFDTDGVDDDVDACPGSAAPGTADGCPVRPAKVSPPAPAPTPTPTPTPTATGPTPTPTVTAPTPTPTATAPTPTSSAPAPAPSPAPAIKAAFVNRWKVAGAKTTIKKLEATKVPKGASVKVLCAKKTKGCPFKAKLAKVVGGKANVAALFGTKRTLRSGAIVEVRISKKAMTGQVMRYTIRKGKKPLVTTMCMKPGSTQPLKSC